MTDKSAEERLAHIETLVTKTHEMIEFRLANLEEAVYKNGIEELRATAVEHHRRIAVLERAEKEGGERKHNYWLMTFTIVLGVAFVGVLIALLKGRGL